jgi:hypothetical protein
MTDRHGPMTTGRLRRGSGASCASACAPPSWAPTTSGLSPDRAARMWPSRWRAHCWTANELNLMALLRVRLAERAYGPPVAQGSAGGSRPVSRLLCPGRTRGGGHPSGTGVAAGLVRSTRGLGRASLRGRVAAAGASPIRPCSGWGLPSRPVTRPLVRSYRTVSPLPVRSRGPAVCSLWHFPAGRPDWPLASTLPCGGRTFLDPGEPGPRPPSRLPLPGQYATHSGAGGGILGAWSRSWSSRSSSSPWPSWRC